MRSTPLRPAKALSASRRVLEDLPYRPTLAEVLSQDSAGNVKERLPPRTLGQTPGPATVSAPLAS
jgi:hypothetical protein